EAEAHAPRERRGARAATSGVEATAALLHPRLRPPLPRPRAPGERGGGLRLPARANPGSRGGHGGAVAQLAGKNLAGMVAAPPPLEPRPPPQQSRPPSTSATYGRRFRESAWHPACVVHVSWTGSANCGGPAA